jgi:hypothetical protein
MGLCNLTEKSKARSSASINENVYSTKSDSGNSLPKASQVLVFADRDEIGDSTFTIAEIGNIPSTKLFAIIGSFRQSDDGFPLEDASILSQLSCDFVP